MQEARRKGKAPIKVISTSNVTQIEVLDEQGVLITLAGMLYPFTRCSKGGH